MEVFLLPRGINIAHLRLAAYSKTCIFACTKAISYSAHTIFQALTTPKGQAGPSS